MDPKKRTRWTAAYARRELKDWRRSGKPLAKYARERGYQAQRLQRWYRRLDPNWATDAGTALALAPVVVTGAARVPVGIAIAAGTVRLEIEDPTAVSPAWIAAVASALRGEVTA